MYLAKNVTWVLIAVLALLLAAVPAEAQRVPDGIPRSAEPAAVLSITDGDTFDIRFPDGTEDTIRLIGIDTPETVDPDRPDGCFGKEAADRLAKLLRPRREIWLEADETDRDRFDRLLRYVWVEKNDGGVYLVNEVMVRDGYAIAKRYPPDRTVRRHIASGHQARCGSVIAPAAYTANTTAGQLFREDCACPRTRSCACCRPPLTPTGTGVCSI